MERSGLSDEIWKARTYVSRYYGFVPGYALLALSFFIPLWPRSLPLLFVLAMAVFLFQYRPFIRPRRVALIQRPVLLFSILMFAVYLIGVLWSEDFKYAREDLWIKLPILVAPVVFFLVRLRLRGKNHFLLAFIMGSVYSILLCILLAAFRSYSGELPWQEEFSYSRFSVLIHPSYFSMYLVFAFAAWFLSGFFNRVKRFASIGVPVILLCGIMMSGSKTGWLGIAGLLPFLLIIKRRDAQVRKYLGLAMLFLMFGSITVYFQSPTIKYRIDELFRSMDSEKTVDPTMKQSTAIRLAIWSCGVEVFKNEPLLGTGTGDVKNELFKVYRKHGMKHAEEKRLNAHSQILQTPITLGLLGVVLLMGIFLVPSYLAVRRNDPIMLIFLILTFCNWLVESMIEVQAGVMFFAWGIFVLSMRK